MNCVLTSESVDEVIEHLMQPVRSSLPAAVTALQYFTESRACRTGLFTRLSGERKPARTCLTLHACFVLRSPEEREKNSACSAGYRITEWNSFFLSSFFSFILYTFNLRSSCINWLLFCVLTQQVQGHAYQNRDEFMEHVRMMHRNSVLYNGMLKSRRIFS